MQELKFTKTNRYLELAESAIAELNKVKHYHDRILKEYPQLESALADRIKQVEDGLKTANEVYKRAEDSTTFIFQYDETAFDLAMEVLEDLVEYDKQQQSKH